MYAFYSGGGITLQPRSSWRDPSTAVESFHVIISLQVGSAVKGVLGAVPIADACSKSEDSFLLRLNLTSLFFPSTGFQAATTKTGVSTQVQIAFQWQAAWKWAPAAAVEMSFPSS